MEQQRALNALEPFVALSQSATSGRAAADLIKQATSHPETYVFAELLQTPNVQALRQSAEYAPHLKLLEIFAWGTYADYEVSRSTLPELAPQQTQKLRLLSLIPLLTTPLSHHIQPQPQTSPTHSTPQPQSQLSYVHLQSALSLPSTQTLEALLTTAISSQLINGHLDPLHQMVAVTSVAPLRDLAPNSVSRMLAVMQEWEGRCDSTLAEIEERVQSIRDNARRRAEVERKRRKMFEEAVEKAGTAWNGEIEAGTLRSGRERGAGGGGASLAGNGKRAAPMNEGGGGGPRFGSDNMDIDEGDGRFGGSGAGDTNGRGSKKPFPRGTR